MKTRKIVMFALAAALVLAAPSTTAFAGSDQRCSARGRDATANCKSLISVGDVTVTVIGDRSLSKNEIKLVKANIDVSKTSVEILNDVTAVIVALNDFGEKSVCVQKGLINVQVCNVF